MCFFNTPTCDATCDGYVMVKKGMKKNMKSVVILGMCQWIWEVPLNDKKPTRNTVYALCHTCDIV